MGSHSSRERLTDEMLKKAMDADAAIKRIANDGAVLDRVIRDAALLSEVEKGGQLLNRVVRDGIVFERAVKDASLMDEVAKSLSADDRSRQQLRRTTGAIPKRDIAASGKAVGDQISVLESRLRDAPFRVDCEVWSADRTYGLGFDRVDQGWGFVYLSRWLEEAPMSMDAAEHYFVHGSPPPTPLAVERKSSDPLKDVSLVKKAKAMELAPELIKHMRAAHAERLAAFEKAQASVSQAMTLLDAIEQEGA